MKRFQKTKYVSAVSSVRRELAGWAATYDSMLLPENQPRYSLQQLDRAERRVNWVQELVDQLSEVEDLLSEEDE